MAKGFNQEGVDYTKTYSAVITPLEDKTLFRSMVGSLQYLTLTRPDIEYQVNHIISQFFHNPTDLYM